MRVAVVGAGAVGASTALGLRKRGADVTLFDAGEVAAGSSGRAAGICYDAFTDRVDVALAGQSLSRFRELSGRAGFSFTPRPYVWVAREGDERRARAIREGVVRMHEHGRRVSLLTVGEFEERFPDLEADVEVAAVAEDAGHADPVAYTRLVAGLAEDRGVSLRTDTPVSLRSGRTVEAEGREERYDAVVVAAGAHTRRLVSPLASLPMKPYRVQALVTEPVDATMPMLYDATGGYYLRPHGPGLLVGDGTEPVERDPDDWDRDADDWFLADCTGYGELALGRSFEPERAWAGLCTATPDGHPLCGRVSGVRGLHVATGFQGHGFMRAPGLGERLADQVLGSEGIGAFDPGRFDGDEAFEIAEGMDVDRNGR